MKEISAMAGECGGLHAYTLSASYNQLQCTLLPAERADTLPLFHLYPICTLCFIPTCKYMLVFFLQSMYDCSHVWWDGGMYCMYSLKVEHYIAVLYKLLHNSVPSFFLSFMEQRTP